MSDNPPTSNRETAIMLLIIAILLPLIFTTCEHKLDESYAHERKQTAQWREENRQADKPYISPTDKAIIDMRDKKP